MKLIWGGPTPCFVPLSLSGRRLPLLEQADCGKFCSSKKDFLDCLVAIVEMEEIPPELVLNWDQTGIKLVPVSTHTMEKEGSK